MQLRQQDFYFHGKDVTIWTVVETATAIIAASIPVLRVFFKDAVSSYSRSRGKSNNRSHSGSVPLSRLSRSHHSNNTTTIQSLGKGRDGGWTSLDPIEDGTEDGASQRGILRDEEQGSEKSGVRAEMEHKGIMQTNTVEVTSEMEVDGGEHRRRRSWLGPPS
jgi:hypothetical protein